MSSIITAPSHSKKAFDISTMPLIVRWAEEHCYKLRADAIVACGHSGLVIAGALSYATRIPVFAARKKGEPVVAGGSSANQISAVAPNGPAKRWIWIDDFLSTGGTFRYAAQQLWKLRLVESPAPAAILSYCGTEGDKKLHTRSKETTWGTRGGKLRYDEIFPDLPPSGYPELIDDFGFSAA